ncbi:MAG: hemolysin III family protein [Patescibacteria group bacterium]|nr:hemolysin III family protein [Patescibacteria group bacterium]
MRSRREEVVSAMIHGFGALAILAASPVLLATSWRQGGVLPLATAGIFIVTALMLYVASTVYHALPPGRTKCRWQAFDHIAIFLLIAGTYTPFALGVLRGPWGWSLFAIVWGLAVAGLLAEWLGLRQVRAMSLGIFLAMGWVAVFAIVPIVQRVPTHGLLLIVAGGMAYTVGTVFYAIERVAYFHAVWHVFVLVGTSLHLAAVMDYAL